MLLSEGQMSDFKGAALMLNALPKAKALLGDKGYDADWFRAALANRGITACIPSKANRKLQIPHDRTLYRQRHRVENMFGKLKDWRRIHTRYDRCAHTFMSAIWLPILTSSLTRVANSRQRSCRRSTGPRKKRHRAVQDAKFGSQVSKVPLLATFRNRSTIQPCR